MKLLLHTCCAPCLIYPLKRLREANFEVSAFFYNPNIQPFSEYKNRKQALEQLNKTLPLEIKYSEYKPEEFFRGVNLKESNPGRCEICWGMRLSATAKFAKENGYEYFTTTLLVSPYQDQQTIKRIGEEVAQAKGVEFSYHDFRSGFREAQREAKEQGLYCQKYCGCIYSEIERWEEP